MRPVVSLLSALALALCLFVTSAAARPHKGYTRQVREAIATSLSQPGQASKVRIRTTVDRGIGLLTHNKRNVKWTLGRAKGTAKTRTAIGTDSTVVDDIVQTPIAANHRAQQ